MDYPFVHRGLLRDEAAKVTIEALKGRFTGKYARRSGHNPLKIVDVESYILNYNVLGYKFIAKSKKGKDIVVYVDRCGDLELIDEPANPW